jgi:hypothetical protein
VRGAIGGDSQQLWTSLSTHAQPKSCVPSCAALLLITLTLWQPTSQIIISTPPWSVRNTYV